MYFDFQYQRFDVVGNDYAVIDKTPQKY